MQVTVLIGIPGSGKSTWAAASGDVVVSRDAIRRCGITDENAVTREFNRQLVRALRGQRDVVVDNTNLRGKYRKDIRDVAGRSGAGEILYVEKFFDTPVDVCRERNAARTEHRVPDEVFERFAEAARPFYLGRVPLRREVIVSGYRRRVQSGPRAVVCDLDGTLADLAGRDPYDPSTCDQDGVNQPVLDAVRLFRSDGCKVFFVSGRSDEFRAQTERWLAALGFDEAPLMRRAGDTRKDSIVKREILENILSGWNVVACIDDRPSVVRMLRYELGLFVFQVNDQEF